MNRAILGATLAGALVFVTPICWRQSWAQDQGRPPAPPALIGMGLPQAPPEQVGMSKQKLERIRDVLKQHVADGKLPGTVVLVARKGKLIYADAIGFQDKEEGKPMALDSVFRIYSMTKPLVSVAAMMLVEDGTIQLTDPVSKFFPAFKGQQVSVARSDNELARMSYIPVAAEREMIVQDLLRHTAGLAYGEITVNAPVRDAYAKAGLYLAGVRDYDARDLTPAEEVERLAKAPLAHQPGTVWEYSMAVDLLGLAAASARGSPGERDLCN
jgi:CubicO group peptidase (beta-lactamase class C family)